MPTSTPFSTTYAPPITALFESPPGSPSERSAALKIKAEEAKRKAEALKKIAESKAAAAMIAVKKARAASAKEKPKQKQGGASSSSVAARAAATTAAIKESGGISSGINIKESVGVGSTPTPTVLQPPKTNMEPIPANLAIIPINANTIEFAAGILGGVLAAVLGGGPLVAVAAAAASNYVSRKDNLGELSEIIQGVSKSSLQTYNFFVKLDAKYEALSLMTDSLEAVIGRLQKSEESGATTSPATLNKVEEAISSVTRQLEKFANDNDLVEGGKQALGVVGDVIETAVDKAGDANREYKLTERVAGAAKNAAKGVVDKAKTKGGIGVVDLPLGAFLASRRDSPGFQYFQNLGGSPGNFRTSLQSNDGTFRRSNRSMFSAPKRKTLHGGGARGVGGSSVKDYRRRRRCSLKKTQSKANLRENLARSNATRLQRIIMPDMATETQSSDEEDEDDPVNNERNNLWEKEDLRAVGSLGDSLKKIDDDLSTLAPGSVKSDDTKVRDNTKVKDSMGYSGFHRLCNAPRLGSADPRWELVRNYLTNLSVQPDLVEEEMEATQREGHAYAPIHVVCMLSPPLDVVEEMVRLYPESLEMRTVHADNALGLACGGFFPASEEVITYLAEVNPDAIEEKDSRMKTPLHQYFEACKFFSFDPYPDVVNMLATIDVVNTRDIRGRSPLYFLGRAARVVLPDSSLRQARNFQKSLDSILIDRPFNSTKFFNELRQLPKKLRDHAFENHVIKLTLNDSMQRAPCTAILMCDIIFQAVIVVAFTFEITRMGEASDLTTVLLIVGCVYWVLRRCASFLASSNRLLYITNFWRVLDLTHVVMLVLSAVQLQKKPVQILVNDDHCRNILIVTSCIVWLVFLSILRSSSKDFAVFVDAAIQITYRLISFIVASTTVLVMFATMFYLSAVQTDMCYDPTSTSTEQIDGDGLNFCSLSASMLKVYALFVGSIEESQFVDIPEGTLVLITIYSFIVIILLLNIIIAIVTDAYQEVNKKAENIFWQHRFAFLNEVDGLINFSFGRFYQTQLDKKKTIKRSHSSGSETKDRQNYIQDRDDQEREKDEHFHRLTSSIHAVSNITDLVNSFKAVIVVFVWLGLGFLSMGYLWPPKVRRFIFCPRILSTYKDKDGLDKDREDEMRGMKEEFGAVKQKLDLMHIMMEQLLASQDATSQGKEFRHSFNN